MKKFDCLEKRSAAIPDRSDEDTGSALAKFTDYVSAKFDCPRIVINGKLHKLANEINCSLASHFNVVAYHSIDKLKEHRKQLIKLTQILK